MPRSVYKEEALEAGTFKRSKAASKAARADAGADIKGSASTCGSSTTAGSDRPSSRRRSEAAPQPNDFGGFPVRADSAALLSDLDVLATAAWRTLPAQENPEREQELISRARAASHGHAAYGVALQALWHNCPDALEAALGVVQPELELLTHKLLFTRIRQDFVNLCREYHDVAAAAPPPRAASYAGLGLDAVAGAPSVTGIGSGVSGELRAAAVAANRTVAGQLLVEGAAALDARCERLIQTQPDEQTCFLPGLISKRDTYLLRDRIRDITRDLLKKAGKKMGSAAAAAASAVAAAAAAAASAAAEVGAAAAAEQERRAAVAVQAVPAGAPTFAFEDSPLGQITRPTPRARRSKNVVPKKRHFFRRQLTEAVFRRLDANGNGVLDSRELGVFAGLTFFESTCGDDEWLEEYGAICLELNRNPEQGLDLAAFADLVDEVVEGGWHCTDSELQGLLAEFVVDGCCRRHCGADSTR